MDLNNCIIYEIPLSLQPTALATFIFDGHLTFLEQITALSKDQIQSWLRVSSSHHPIVSYTFRTSSWSPIVQILIYANQY